MVRASKHLELGIQFSELSGLRILFLPYHIVWSWSHTLVNGRF